MITKGTQELKKKVSMLDTGDLTFEIHFGTWDPRIVRTLGKTQIALFKKPHYLGTNALSIWGDKMIFVRKTSFVLT